MMKKHINSYGFSGCHMFSSYGISPKLGQSLTYTRGARAAASLQRWRGAAAAAASQRQGGGRPRPRRRRLASRPGTLLFRRESDHHSPKPYFSIGMMTLPRPYFSVGVEATPSMYHKGLCTHLDRSQRGGRLRGTTRRAKGLGAEIMLTQCGNKFHQLRPERADDATALPSPTDNPDY